MNTVITPAVLLLVALGYLVASSKARSVKASPDMAADDADGRCAGAIQASKLARAGRTSP